MKQLFTAFILLVATPFAAMAQEGGMVILNIGDVAHEFPLDPSQSDWSGGVSYGSVNIFTKPVDDATWALFKRLTLGFTIMNTSVDAPEVSLSRMVDGELSKLFGSNDTGAVVNVDEVAVDGEFLTISGGFSSDLGTSKNYGGTIDASDPIAVSGTFSVTLGPVE